MSSREMSMDTIMEDEDSFVSNTDAIIYASSDISGWTHSLISDNNIPNSSSSTSVDDCQQQISTAGDGDDSMIVSSGASSSWFNNNKQLDDQQEIRIFNVDFRALCNNTCGVMDQPAQVSREIENGPETIRKSQRIKQPNKKLQDYILS
ncbi:hypothetical protein MTR67_045381 [Solanum verrucosum]|uniref:Uncharacterized protein n=1 Tax=Solanum verrucosum TaxID=315347 RepID=A0AAF0UVA6_SOLVR|nr:hypothetical protein MTR67_045381 [Solanum verrucosum]